MSEESIPKSDSNFTSTFVDYHLLPDMHFNGYCLIKNSISIVKQIINLYISNTLGPQLNYLSGGFTLGSCLFGFVKPTKNADIDKYKHSGYSIGLDSRSEF